MKRPLIQLENRVRRTYCGGKALDEFLGKTDPRDTFLPEDWISSFVEAKNRDPIEGEGITKVLLDGKVMPITEAVSKEDLGEGRTECGVLVKLLDAGERLGVQVHPTPHFSLEHFSDPHGKTECWHILRASDDAAVYIGFKEGISREKWKSLFERQDIEAMLGCLHKIKVREGDTVLVRAGTPHAIGKGCFLLEIQEPTDYTMRVEKVTVAGERLTPMQIHYGVGEEALLDCFVYEGLSESEARKRYLLSPKIGENGYADEMLVTYDDTPCFALGVMRAGGHILPDSFVTIVSKSESELAFPNETVKLKRGDKLFVPYGCGEIRCALGEVIVCYPPKL